MTAEIWPLFGATIAIAGLILAQGRFAAQRLDKRFESIDKRFESMEQHIDKRFEAVEQQINNLRNDVTEVRDRVSRIEGSVQTLLQVILDRPAA